MTSSVRKIVQNLIDSADLSIANFRFAYSVKETDGEVSTNINERGFCVGWYEPF